MEIEEHTFIGSCHPPAVPRERVSTPPTTTTQLPPPHVRSKEVIFKWKFVKLRSFEEFGTGRGCTCWEPVEGNLHNYLVTLYLSLRGRLKIDILVV